MELIEVAPGIDIERDILAHMDFRPIIENPALMPAAVFAPDAMKLRERMRELPFSARFSYDPVFNMLFIDFEQLAITSDADLARIRAEVERQVGPLGRRVFAIVNYTGSTISPAIAPRFAAMVEELAAKHYLEVTRYGLKGELADRLGVAKDDRDPLPDLNPRVPAFVSGGR